MERSIKCKPNNLCIAIFTLCLSVRFIEYFLIETDQTVVGENVLHKVAGIIILALALKKIELSWSDIGFQRNGFGSSILKGLLFSLNGADELQIVRVMVAQIILCWQFIITGTDGEINKFLILRR